MATLVGFENRFALRLDLSVDRRKLFAELAIVFLLSDGEESAAIEPANDSRNDIDSSFMVKSNRTKGETAESRRCCRCEGLTVE
jgi:hypothetical protein